MKYLLAFYLFIFAMLGKWEPMRELYETVMDAGIPHGMSDTPEAHHYELVQMGLREPVTSGRESRQKSQTPMVCYPDRLILEYADGYKPPEIYHPLPLSWHAWLWIYTYIIWLFLLRKTDPSFSYRLKVRSWGMNQYERSTLQQ